MFSHSIRQRCLDWAFHCGRCSFTKFCRFCQANDTIVCTNRGQAQLKSYNESAFAIAIPHMDYGINFFLMGTERYPIHSNLNPLIENYMQSAYIVVGRLFGLPEYNVTSDTYNIFTYAVAPLTPPLLSLSLSLPLSLFPTLSCHRGKCKPITHRSDTTTKKRQNSMQFLLLGEFCCATRPVHLIIAHKSNACLFDIMPAYDI